MKEVFYAKCVFLTFVDGKPVINIGPGDHTCIRYELTWDQVRGLYLDAAPHLIKR